MKKQILAFIAAGSVLAACGNSSESNDTANNETSSAGQVQGLMSSPEGTEADGTTPADSSGEAPGAPPTTNPSSSFMPRDPAQALINAYDNNTLANLSTKYYLADLQQLKSYVDYAISQEGKDAQLIFGRKEDGQVTIIITAVKPDGTHILYNDGAVPSVLENCLPCPPGTNCYTNTNLNH
jgi:hypothetical protein